MFISNTNFAASAAAYVSKTHSANTAESVQTTQRDSVRSGADSVTISDAGRQAAYAEKVMTGAQNDAAGAHPLKMYQMPSWHAEYMFEVPGQLGVSANWFAEKYPQAAATSMSERTEYANLVQSHYQAVLDANGIQGVEDHYKATILDQDFSESLRQQMSERIQGDARLLELMAKMGKTIS